MRLYNMIQENGVYHCRESLSFARDIEELTKLQYRSF